VKTDTSVGDPKLLNVDDAGFSTRRAFLNACGLLQGRKVQYLNPLKDPDLIEQILESTDKGTFVEDKIACDAWDPIRSVESVDYSEACIMKTTLSAIFQHVDIYNRIPLIVEELILRDPVFSVKLPGLGSSSSTDDVTPANAAGVAKITSRDIVRHVFEVNFKLLVGRFPKAEEIAVAISASDEWRKMIAVKGIGDMSKKTRFLNLMRELLSKESPFLNTAKTGLDWTNWNVLSSVMQPLMVSPMINFADISTAFYELLEVHQDWLHKICNAENEETSPSMDSAPSSPQRQISPELSTLTESTETGDSSDSSERPYNMGERNRIQPKQNQPASGSPKKSSPKNIPQLPTSTSQTSIASSTPSFPSSDVKSVQCSSHCPAFRSRGEQLADLCVLETIRCRHPFPIVERVVKRDISNGHTTLKKNTQIFIEYDQFTCGNVCPATGARARHPRVFDPSRWAQPECPFSAIPFAAGPRRCYGQKVARSELSKLMYAYCLNWENFEPKVGHEFSGRNNDDAAGDVSYLLGVLGRCLRDSLLHRFGIIKVYGKHD